MKWTTLLTESTKITESNLIYDWDASTRISDQEIKVLRIKPCCAQSRNIYRQAVSQSWRNRFEIYSQFAV